MSLHIIVTHSFSFVEVTHADVALVVAAEVNEVDGSAHPEIEAWHPHQNSVLETLSEVWVCSVPCTVPILVLERKRNITVQFKMLKRLFKRKSHHRWSVDLHHCNSLGLLSIFRINLEKEDAHKI